jgi:hypothetical protein
MGLETTTEGTAEGTAAAVVVPVDGRGANNLFLAASITEKSTRFLFFIAPRTPPSDLMVFILLLSAGNLERKLPWCPPRVDVAEPMTLLLSL